MDTGGARKGNCSAMLVRKYVLFGKDSEKWLGRCAGGFNSAPLHVFSHRRQRGKTGTKVRTGMARGNVEAKKHEQENCPALFLPFSCPAPSLVYLSR